MPRIIRAGMDASQSHPPWIPMSLPIAGNAKNVFVEGVNPIVVGDKYTPHTCPPPPACDGSTHIPVAIMGSSRVFMNGIPVVRDADSLSCGDVADNGSNRVFADGGGRGGPAAENDPRESTGYSIPLPKVSMVSNIVLTAIHKPTISDPTDYKFHHWREFEDLSAVKNVWSPLIEEDSNKEYRNYPGPPLTKNSGAILPSYAPEGARKPFSIKMGLATPLPSGMTLDLTTGVLSGPITEKSDVGVRPFFYVSFTNFVGSINKKVSVTVKVVREK